MRHRWTVFPTLIILGLGLCGFAKPARGGEPLDDLLGRRTVPIFLLTRSDVQADLKLDPKQVAICGHAAITLQHRALRLRGRKDAGAAAARRVVDQEMSLLLSDNLTPGQLARLDQIDLQWEGAAAMLTRPFLDDSLNLIPEQRKKVAECIADANSQRARGGLTYEDHINHTRKAIAILDERQRNVWIHVLGPHCAFKVDVRAKTAQNQPASQVPSNPAPTLR
jgi:hypothetical protein